MSETGDEIEDEILKKLETLIRLVTLGLLEDIEHKEEIQKERVMREIVPLLLDTDRKRMVYEMTDGKNSRREIAENLKISSATLTKWWKSWYSYGILTVEKKKYKRIVSLRELGIRVPSNRPRGG
jgi:DNA-binding transcriptional ArsR family regulator